MTQSTLTPPGRIGLEERSNHLAAASALRRRHVPVGGAFAPATVLVTCIVVHLIAAGITYRDMAQDLYSLFDETPRLLVLEHGIVRLTAISVFLPPVIPTALLIGIGLWLGKAGRTREVSHRLAMASVPLAADSALRAIGVTIASTPAKIGELLDLPTRFSPGPRMVLDLVGVQPSPGVAYWAVVCNVAAVISAWYAVQGLVAAESVSGEFRGRRRLRDSTSMDVLRAATVVIGTWLALAVMGQIMLPFATQFVLQALG